VAETKIIGIISRSATLLVVGDSVSQGSQRNNARLDDRLLQEKSVRSKGVVVDL
jgi:hypothetical protein